MPEWFVEPGQPSPAGFAPDPDAVPAALPSLNSPPSAATASDDSGRRSKDGQEWEIGSDAEVAWITGGTTIGVTIRSAIPPVFESYATVVLPGAADLRVAHERSLMQLLTQRSGDQAWWLGYLDTGADDVVFPDAPRVRMYAGWPYVLVKAGPVQAQKWRSNAPFTMHSQLPDLMFPADRTWLLSALWDDDWWSVGGSASLIDAIVLEPALESYVVSEAEDATPPGHIAR